MNTSEPTLRVTKIQNGFLLEGEVPVINTDPSTTPDPYYTPMETRRWFVSDLAMMTQVLDQAFTYLAGTSANN